MHSNATRHHQLRVVRVQSLHELRDHAPRYTQLIAGLRGLESLYYSLDWIEAVYPLYERCGARMFFLLIYRDDDLIGVAPFQTASRGALGMRFTRLEFWGAVDCYVKNVHQNILCANDDRRQVLDTLADYLIHNRSVVWDVIQFYRINLQESCLREFTERFEDGIVIENPLKSYSFKAPWTIDQRLNRKERWTIRDADKRLARDFSSHSVRVVDSFDDSHLNCMAELHTRRQELLIQNGAHRDRFLNDPQGAATIEKLIHTFQRQGKVRCYQLIVEDNVIAFLLVFSAKDEALVLFTAFDDQYRKYHPSRYLWHAAYKNEIENLGMRVIDTSYGETIIKRDFSTHTHDLYDIEIWRPGLDYYTALKTVALKGIRNSKANIRNSKANVLSWYLAYRELWSRLSFCGVVTAFC